VAAQHHAPPVVVAEQLVPEGPPVFGNHGVVPGRRDHGDHHDRQQHRGQKLRASQPLPVPGEEQVSDENDYGQAQAGKALGQHRQAAQHGRNIEVEGAR